MLFVQVFVHYAIEVCDRAVTHPDENVSEDAQAFNPSYRHTYIDIITNAHYQLNRESSRDVHIRTSTYRKFMHLLCIQISSTLKLVADDSAAMSLKKI